MFHLQQAVARHCRFFVAKFVSQDCHSKAHFEYKALPEIATVWDQ